MRRNEPPGSQRHEDLKTIEKHVRSCKAIVEDLLHFARSSTPSKAAVDLHGLIDEVLPLFGQHLRKDQIRIDKDYDPKIPRLQLDEKKIRQVLVNLVMNAVHAVGKSGAIRVATRLDAANGSVLLKIGDNGCGIEKRNLARIFDPFFTTKPTGQGTGLGLSVSYGIVKSHGGDIQVESTPGQGATFTVVLPVSPAT
jgi:signal transduction histidine kinase